MSISVSQQISSGYAKFNNLWDSAKGAKTSQECYDNLPELLEMQTRLNALAKKATKETVFPGAVNSAEGLADNLAAKISRLFLTDFKELRRLGGSKTPSSSGSTTSSSSSTSTSSSSSTSTSSSSNPQLIDIRNSDEFGPPRLSIHGHIGCANMSMGNCAFNALAAVCFNDPALKDVFTTVGRFYAEGNTPDSVRMEKFFELLEQEGGLSEESIKLFKATESHYWKSRILQKLLPLENGTLAVQLMDFVDDGSSFKQQWTKLISGEKNPEDCVKQLLLAEEPKEKIKQDKLKNAGKLLRAFVAIYDSCRTGEGYGGQPTTVPLDGSQRLRLALHYIDSDISIRAKDQEDGAALLNILLTAYNEIIQVQKRASPLFSLIQEKIQFQPMSTPDGKPVLRLIRHGTPPPHENNTTSSTKYDHLISLIAPHYVQDTTVEALLAGYFKSRGDEIRHFRHSDGIHERAFEVHLTRKFTGFRPPHALNLVINRGGGQVINDKGDWRGHKVNTRVMASRLMVLPANATLKNKPLVYNLKSFFIHKGTIAGGHYVAYILDEEEDQWYEIDDRYVRKVSKKAIDAILLCRTDNPTYTPYVLNYRLVPDARQEEMLKLASVLNDVPPLLDPIAPPAPPSTQPKKGSGPSKLPETDLSKKGPGPLKLPEPTTTTKKDSGPSELPEPSASSKTTTEVTSGSILAKGEQLIALLEKLQMQLKGSSQPQEISKSLEEIKTISPLTYERLFRLIAISEGMKDDHHVRTILLHNPKKLLASTLPWFRNSPSILEQCIHYEQERLEIHRANAAGDLTKANRLKNTYLTRNLQIYQNLLNHFAITDSAQLVAIFDILDLPKQRLFSSLNKDAEAARKQFVELPWCLSEPITKLLSSSRTT